MLLWSKLVCFSSDNALAYRITKFYDTPPSASKLLVKLIFSLNIFNQIFMANDDHKNEISH
jgi:hypothetical protein